MRILKGSLAHHVGLERIEVLLSLLEGSQRVTLPERRIGGIGMSVRLPDDDVAFYWPPPTSCRRGNVPNSKSVASLRSCGRILTRARTVNAAVGTVLHGLQVASPAPPRSGQCGWRARQDDDFCGHGVDTKRR